MFAFKSDIISISSFSSSSASLELSSISITTKSGITIRAQSNHHLKKIKNYVLIIIIILIQFLCSKIFIKSNLPKIASSLLIESQSSEYKIFMNKTRKMADRLNIGREVRELTLGSTFAPQNSKTAFHTLKYDFKPASVDTNKVANLDVSSNNQVTVTVPNIDSAGNPTTVFKGNQRKYTKECVIIFDRKTGLMTLEKLNHNIQVKKTRSEQSTKVAPPPPPQKLENNTQRTSSKTRVSTGIRKNAIIGFPRSSPMQQNSPSYSAIHKSPQSAPAWNANNGQSTLPSIPLIGLDDDVDIPQHNTVSQQNINHSSSTVSTAAPNNFDFQPLIQQQQQYQQQNGLHQNNHSGNSSGMMPNLGVSAGTTTLESAAAVLEQEIGVLSSSDSSSDSESSGSGSDSDNGIPPQKSNAQNNHHHHSNHHHQQQQQQLQPQHHQSYANGSFPALLHDDLQLSESNSSDSDDD